MPFSHAMKTEKRDIENDGKIIKIQAFNFNIGARKHTILHFL